MNYRKFIIRYKILHILIWLGVSFFFMLIFFDISQPIFPQYIGNLLVTALTIPACYFAAKNLTVNYLYQKRIMRYIGFLLLLAFLNAILTYLVALFIYHLLTGLPMFRSVLYVVSIGLTILMINIMMISISCAIQIISDRFFMEEQLHMAEKEKITTELNFLRSQVNPHFLFNVMNTIYFQIDKGNTAARTSVEKLSEMLRYQLYECTTDKIDIMKELEYIKNYVGIQSLRMEKGTDIKFDAEGNLAGFTVAPLLLLPIIENAFKHISNFKNPEENKIHILLKNENGREFSIQILNTFDKANNSSLVLNSGGLGMQNLKRRLDLLYPHKHFFNIEQRENLFETILKIQYND